MARLMTTADVFAAIAEPRRRDLLGVLARSDGERDVSSLVDVLGWPQPQISRHLAVLRRAGLVRVQRSGRQRLYSLGGEELRAVYDWIKAYERFWDDQLQRIKDRAERLQAKQRARQSHVADERPLT